MSIHTPKAQKLSSVEAISRVCNHPSVRPYLGGDTDIPLDLAHIFDDARNVTLTCDGFYAMYCLVIPGHYEIHTMVDPGNKPDNTVAAACATLEYMFTKTDCIEVITRVPDGNRSARRLAEAAGMKMETRVSRGWVVNGSVEECDILTLPLTSWMANADGLETYGEEFHRQIDEACTRAGAVRDAHPEDRNHDRYAGATFEMIRGGQMEKAVVAYNRWAGIAGYKPVVPLSKVPPIIHIGDMAVRVYENQLEVVKCQ